MREGGREGGREGERKGLVDSHVSEKSGQQRMPGDTLLGNSRDLGQK